MADIKWIKITTDIFDDEKIKIIDKYPARDEILVIWFKLLTLAGKTNFGGLLFLSDKIVYTKDMLSAVFNREEKTIEMALAIFVRLQMITIEDNEIIAIANWEKHQALEGLDKIKQDHRISQKKYREKQKLLISDVTSDITVTNPSYSSSSSISSSSSFKIPNIEEIKAYCIERNKGVDAERYFDFYQSKGWIVGKTKMKDWKASVRTWESKDKSSVDHAIAWVEGRK